MEYADDYSTVADFPRVLTIGEIPTAAELANASGPQGVSYEFNSKKMYDLKIKYDQTGQKAISAVEFNVV